MSLERFVEETTSKGQTSYTEVIKDLFLKILDKAYNKIGSNILVVREDIFKMKTKLSMGILNSNPELHPLISSPELHLPGCYAKLPMEVYVERLRNGNNENWQIKDGSIRIEERELLYMNNGNNGSRHSLALYVGDEIDNFLNKSEYISALELLKH